MVEVFCLLGLGGVVLLVVWSVVSWFGRVARNAGASRALKAWFADHGSDFFDGVLSEDHPLYRPLATKLSYEPEPPGHIEQGTLWWAGAGTHGTAPFTFVGHSPSHPNFPTTWRLFLEAETGLAEGEVLILCAEESAVFVEGPFAKRTLDADASPGGWGWAAVRSRGEGAQNWLTPARSAPLKALLQPGRALHVYPGFVVAVLHGDAVVPFVTACLDALLPMCMSEGGAAGAVGEGEGSEAQLRERVDWSPSGAREWSEITADPNKMRWSFQAAPDNTFQLVAVGMTGLALLAGGLQSLEEGVEPISIGIFAVILAALNVFAWRDGWDRGAVGELDLEAQTFRTAKGATLAAASSGETQDLSTARALQLVHSIRRRSGSGTTGSGQFVQTVRTLHACIVCLDGRRIPLARFDAEAFWDQEREVARVPEVIREICAASGWRLLVHL